jgi:hypothetical protein
LNFGRIPSTGDFGRILQLESEGSSSSSTCFPLVDFACARSSQKHLNKHFLELSRVRMTNSTLISTNCALTFIHSSLRTSHSHAVTRHSHDSQTIDNNTSLKCSLLLCNRSRLSRTQSAAFALEKHVVVCPRSAATSYAIHRLHQIQPTNLRRIMNPRHGHNDSPHSR